MLFFGLVFLKNTGNEKWNSSCCILNFNFVLCFELTINRVTLRLLAGYRFVMH